MSRVLKSTHVKLDHENAVNIEVMDTRELSKKTKEKEEKNTELSEEVKAGQVLFKARNEAENIIRSAQYEAQVIIQNAKEQAETQSKIVMRDAYNEGHEEGYGQGMKDAEGLKEEAQKILEDAICKRDEIISSIEGDMLNLITGILDKLLADTKDINPQVIINLIKQGLSSSSDTGEVKIHVSPDDIDTVTGNKDEILSMLDRTASVEIINDSVLRKSDCIIETPFGNIDCSLDQQYEALRRDLYYILNEHGGKG